MPEALPYATLTILGGALKGTQLEIDDAVDDVLIGSDPDCRLCLDLPGVSPIHARLWLDMEGATLHDTRSSAGVWVNDDRVVEQHPLKDGDIVWLGQPGGPEGGVIQLRRCMEAPAAPPPVVEPPPAPARPAPPAPVHAEPELHHA